jgi:hypothetical protein
MRCGVWIVPVLLAVGPIGLGGDGRPAQGPGQGTPFALTIPCNRMRHLGTVSSVAYSPGGKILVSGGAVQSCYRM